MSHSSDVVDLTRDSPPRIAQPRKRALPAAEVISLLDSDDDGDGGAQVAKPRAGRARVSGGVPSKEPRRGPTAGARVTAEVAPAWVGARGTKRVMMEYQALARAVADGSAPCAELRLPDERNVCCWQFALRDFDADMPGGAALNADLARLAREHGQDHLLCEVSFPSDYPSRPFSLRLISPRCAWYTGHVTAGGSVCMEALAQTGSANAWRPEFCVLGLLPLVKHNMIDVDAVMVRTATGPGGMAGPLRVDFEQRWHRTRSPLEPYSAQEAAAAFARTEAHHRQNGW